MDRLSASSSPNLVKSVSPSELAPVPIQDREGCLVFYGPRKAQKNEPPIYEVVVNSDKHSFR